MSLITILKVNVSKAPKGYDIAEVAYKTDDGKTKGQKILSFVQKDIFAIVKDLKAGDQCNASFEQNDKGFWQFKSITPTGEKAEVVETPKAAKASNWETPDERAARQVLIVRQSCIGHAIQWAEVTKSKVDLVQVIELAEMLKDYVFNGIAKKEKEVE